MNRRLLEVSWEELMIGSGICLLILAALVPELAMLRAIGILSLIGGVTLNVAGAPGRSASGGRQPY